MPDEDDITLRDLDDLTWSEGSKPIPSGTIGLADAYYAVLCAVTPRWSDLCDKVEQIELEMIKYEDETGTAADLSDYDWALHGTERAQRQAHQFFRSKLVAEELKAYIQDAATKEFVRLKAAGWKAADASVLGGILDDYGGTIENPRHPEAAIAGVKCRVFFLTDDFNKWMGKTFRRPVGRPPDSGSWNLADEPLLKEMEQLIHAGKASSAFNAASQVVGKAAGSGSDDSKIRRLERRYNARNRTSRSGPS
jgi:hypothetical protein